VDNTMKFILLLCVFTLMFVIQCRVLENRLEHSEQIESVIRKTYYVEALTFKLAQVNHTLLSYKYEAPQTKEQFINARTQSENREVKKPD